MPGAMVVKQCGLRCTGSLSRLVRVSSCDERGRRATALSSVSWNCPGNGSKAGLSGIEQYREIPCGFKHFGDDYVAVWSAIECFNAAIRHVKHVDTGHHLEQLAGEVR